MVTVVSFRRWHKPEDIFLDGDPYKPPFRACAIYSETTIVTIYGIDQVRRDEMACEDEHRLASPPFLDSRKWQNLVEQFHFNI